MITKYKTKILKVNTSLKDKKSGDTFRVKCDSEGIILDPYWRRRVKDSALDNCVEIMVSKKTTKKKKGDNE